MDLFFAPEFTRSEYNFETTRKSMWIFESLREFPVRGVKLKSPYPVTESDLRLIHEDDYISAVKNGIPIELAESQGFPWDRHLFPMVLSTTGGMVDAVRSALRTGVAGTLSSGLHHARTNCGKGYCTFNGLALAAKMAIFNDVKSVLILDLDAHCGGGTKDCISDDSRIYQLDISVDTFDGYESNNQCRLVMVQNGIDYLSEIECELDTLSATRRPFDLCIYNAGMDPYEYCTNGGKQGINIRTLAQREKMVFSWCRSNKIPVAFTIAGGYLGGRLEQCDIIRLHRLTIEAAAEVFPSE
jgi:acetoin utilization deacetylase AcuC-like enzyme